MTYYKLKWPFIVLFTMSDAPIFKFFRFIDVFEFFICVNKESTKGSYPSCAIFLIWIIILFERLLITFS